MGFSSLVIVKIFRFNVILIYWKYLSVKQQNQNRRQEEEEEQNDLKAITLPRNVLLFIGLKFNYGQLQLNVKANDLQVINLRFVYSYLLSRIDRLSPCRIQGRIYWLPERASVIANGNGNGGWAAIFAEVEACHKFYWMKLFPSFFFRDEGKRRWCECFCQYLSETWIEWIELSALIRRVKHVASRIFFVLPFDESI